MSARDDYKWLADQERFRGDTGAAAVLDEIDRLRSENARRAAKQRAYRDRLRGAPPRPLAPCGTVAAYRRHQRRGEPVDAACRDAYNAAHRTMYHQRKERM